MLLAWLAGAFIAGIAGSLYVSSAVGMAGVCAPSRRGSANPHLTAMRPPSDGYRDKVVPPGAGHQRWAGRGRPAGCWVQMWGHGLRTRQVRGPLAPGEKPMLVTVDGRRYQCQVYDAVVIVEPRSVLRYRYFSASAIAMALFGVDGEPAPEVRRRVSPWRTVGHAACRGWMTLRHWIDVARQGLLPGARHRVAGDDRAVASRVAHAVAARAPPRWDAPIAARAFAGAALPA